MILYQVLFILFLIALFQTKAAIAFAAKAGDARRVRVLQVLRLGLGLSACSYLLHILIVPLTGLFLFSSLFSCFVGTVLIYTSWMQQWQHYHERRRLQANTIWRAGDRPDTAQVEETAQPDEAWFPPLNGSAKDALMRARDEARHWHQPCVDTNHLLAGLLREPCSEAIDILNHLGLQERNISLALGQAPRSNVCAPQPKRSEQSQSEEVLVLTDRVKQVFVLAAQEAHRFDKTVVGTDHLLLGLVLVGTGPAALVLFQSGVTVDNIRGEILKKTAA